MGKPSRKGTTKKYLELRCKGSFRFGGRFWTSNMVFVGVKVDTDSDTALVVKRWRQQARGSTVYVSPKISKKELTRVTELALKVAKEARANRDPSELAFEPIEAPKEPHDVDHCERCASRGVPCTSAIEILEGSWIHINDTTAWKKRRQPINRMRSLVQEAKTSGATTIDSVHRRLREKDKVMVLYHQTSEESAESILRSQYMRKGHSGMLGAAIYFAKTAAETDAKALDHGVILKCLVYVGKRLKVPGPCPHMSLNELFDEKGCDSVLATFPRSGHEIAVYASDQVLMIEQA